MRGERKKFLLMENLAQILKEIVDPNVIFTIFDVSLPQKGGVMKVKLSIFPDKKASEVIKSLNKESLKIKNKLKEKMYLRYLPKKIIFRYTSDLKNFQIIDKILKREG